MELDTFAVPVKNLKGYDYLVSPTNDEEYITIRDVTPIDGLDNNYLISTSVGFLIRRGDSLVTAGRIKETTPNASKPLYIVSYDNGSLVDSDATPGNILDGNGGTILCFDKDDALRIFSQEINDSISRLRKGKQETEAERYAVYALIPEALDVPFDETHTIEETFLEHAYPKNATLIVEYFVGDRPSVNGTKGL